jgi:hypothetical protein
MAHDGVAAAPSPMIDVRSVSFRFGSGEDGVPAVPAVINGAVDDALSGFGVYTAETPVLPLRLYTWGGGFGPARGNSPVP